MSMYGLLGSIGATLTAAFAAGRELFTSARDVIATKFDAIEVAADFGGTEDGETVGGAIRACHSDACGPTTMTDATVEQSFALTFEVKPELPDADAANDNIVIVPAEIPVVEAAPVVRVCNYTRYSAGKPLPCGAALEASSAFDWCDGCRRYQAVLDKRREQDAKRPRAPQPNAKPAPAAAVNVDRLREQLQTAINANGVDGKAFKRLLEQHSGVVNEPASAGSWQRTIVVTVGGVKRSLTVMDEKLRAKILADKAEAAEAARKAQAEAARLEAERRKNAPKPQPKPAEAKSKDKAKSGKGQQGKGGKGNRHEQRAAA